MIVETWSYTPPSGASLYEHCKMLPLKLLQIYAKGGSPGCLVVSPEIGAILDHQPGFRVESALAGPIRRLGTLREIVPVWVNLDIVRNEALAVTGPDDVYPTAKLVVEDLVDDTPLDYLAQL